MNESFFSGRPKVTIAGTPLDEGTGALIDLLVIDDHLALPDQLTIIWRDPTRDVLEKSRATIGAPIEVGVTATGRGEADNAVLFKGEITGLEGDYGLQGQRVSLRAYDLSHRLHRGRRAESYTNKKDSDIAKKLAQEAQLPLGEITDTPTVHDHIAQVNLTDWEFLVARAREIGYHTGMADGKFVFRPVDVNQNAPGPGGMEATGALQMTFGTDLLEFAPRLSGVAQVRDVVARGWSYLDKEAVVGRATTRDCNSAPVLSDKPSDIAGKFPTKPYVITDRVLATQGEADHAAQGAAHRISAALGEADGVARGNTKIRTGAALSINAVAAPFVGTWTVTNSRHVFDSQGYRTLFSVTGHHERSLLGLTSVGATSGTDSAGGPPVYGVVIGLVTNIKDPENLSRVKVEFPWLADRYETDWVRFAMPSAGPDRGFMWLPEVGDEVLIAFEHGDVRRPYVLGALYNGRDKWDHGGSDQYSSVGTVQRRGWRAKGGESIGFLDFPGKKGIFLETGDGAVKIKLDESSTEVTVHSDGTVVIKGREVTVEAQTSMTVKAGTELSLKAPKVAINGDTLVEVKGAMITLN